MNSRKIACACASTFIGVALVASSTAGLAKPRGLDVVVGKKVDPETQRRVSYADLNLTARADQKVLGGRIFRTAGDLCFDLNDGFGLDNCRTNAVRSTDAQVGQAIERAHRRMAGLPVGPAVAISMVISAD